MIYCHAAKISGIILLLRLHVATLLRSLGSFYYVYIHVCLRCWDLWDRVLRYIHVCDAAEISGIVYYVYIHVATLPEISGIVYYVYMFATLLRSLVSFYYVYMLLRCWDLWYRLLTLHVATLLRSLGSFYYVYMFATLLRSLGSFYYVTCRYAAEISGIVLLRLHTCCYAAEISEISESLAMEIAFTRMLTASCFYYACVCKRWRWKNEKKTRPKVFFQDFPIIKISTALW